MKNLNVKPIIKIHRSNKYIYAQVLDNGKIIDSSSSLKFNKNNTEKSTKSDQAKFVGVDLAKKLINKKIKSVVINRGRYLYLGRFKALVEGLREGGLKV